MVGEKFVFHDGKKNCHPFWIVNHKFDTDNELCVITCDIKNNDIDFPFHYALQIIKNSQGDYIVLWNNQAIDDYANIIDYKEFIDRAVKLLVFS